MSLTKYASLEGVQILDLRSSRTKAHHASLGKLADFHEYRTDDGFLYARIRAISSRVNKNHDGWPSIELAGGQDIFDRHLSSSDGFTVVADRGHEHGFSTFLGKPIFLDHHNSDPNRTRGAIVDAQLHVADHKTASLDPYYASPDVDPEHLPGTWVELLLEVDAKAFPKFAKAIVEGGRNSKKGIDGWSMGCFVPGTPITLADGTQKPIETIDLGDQVLTHTGKTEPVTYLLARPYHGLVYELSTYGQSQPVRMTEEHPVWIKRTPGGKDAPKGGMCACGRTFPSKASFSAHLREVRRHNLAGDHSRESGEVITWIPANEVREGDYVLTPVPEGVGHPGSYPFARLLGYYLAEGNLGFDRKRFPDGRPVSVEWTFAVDELEYQQEIKFLLEGLGYRMAGPYIKNGAASVRCNSPELASRLLAHGGQHAWAKRLIPDVLRWTPENQRALLDAYLNGDGHYDGNHVEAGTASQALAQQLQLLASRAGYRMTPSCEQHSPSARAAGSRPKYVLQGVLTAPSLSANARAHLTTDGLWRRVERIVLREYEGQVYNFDVEGDDSYVAADIAVHNCDVTHSLCSICKNSATSPEEYCNHIKMKGAYFDWVNPKTGHKTSKKAYENCYGVSFFEISGVFDPADETALSREVRSKTQEETITQDPKEKGLKDLADEQAEDYLDDTERGKQRRKKRDASLVRQADNPPPQSEMSHAPEHVDTLREEEVCPVCGSSMDEDTCDVCGYEQPPEGFGNPDLTKAQDVDVPNEPMDDSRLDAPGVDPNEGPAGAPTPPEATNTPTNPAMVAHVTSDMDWDVHSKTSARINKVEQPLVPTDKPQTNEPKETIIKDQLRPVTSRVRTAEEFIAAAGATRRNTMNHTADAASGAPAVAKPDVHTDVTGVGGVDQASNDAASKADAQVEVTAIGGTGVESVAAEQEGVNVEQGDEHSKNIEAIPTKTWSDGQGDSLGQHDPVTNEPFPAHEDGVTAVSSWVVEGHDDGPFPPDAGIGGGTAVQGNKPIAEQFGDRVNVLEHVTSPANNSGETKTWSGTDGNGVNKQQDPVTPESIALGESGITDAPNWTSATHIFASFKLADLEVDLGLIPADKKYERAAELERESATVVQTSLKYAQRIKQASARKTAGVAKLPVMGRPSIEKEASTEAVPSEDDSFMFGGV